MITIFVFISKILALELSALGATFFQNLYVKGNN